MVFVPFLIEEFSIIINTNIALRNSTVLDFPSLIDCTIKRSDKALTAFVPTHLTQQTFERL